MRTINWLSAFNRLFEMINSEESYHSGPEFLKTIMDVDYSIPNYTQLIKERKKLNKSTSRKDYFYDLLMSLSQEKRIKAYQKFIDKLEKTFPKKTEGLKSELKLNGNTSNSKHVKQVSVPTDIWNSDKLNDYLEKMDKAITEKKL